jgi:hypothetical protein
MCVAKSTPASPSPAALEPRRIRAMRETREIYLRVTIPPRRDPALHSDRVRNGTSRLQYWLVSARGAIAQ